MILSGEEMGALFQNFERSAFRLETHQTYTMPNEQAGLARFLAGEPKPEGHNANWTAYVRQTTASGKTIQRAKVVKRPFTDYTRYLMSWGVPGNVAAGEDYRIADVTEHPPSWPDQDFWLFDESTVALLNFNADGTLRGRELADPAELGTYLHWRDLALSETIPFVDYRF
ncbi:hypothetical protein SAMN05421504_104296 [Amycolatopsis xylanica]|uniref:DUF6879 domain-containing protein n=1 Tax=Amycolatopsis xylanica TaxID=589385 RepID=A0A1H3GL53_9PSEU|nr:DUF6879 family protein [Amycolatopsis xylanica]SDY03715.1 hypothetical protein SAMN05421504_104296 [Amycolatopsis xylanica]